MNNQYLEVLEISSGASKTDIKKAYRRLSKRYHPDLSSDEHAKEKFILINEAYRFLMDVGPRPVGAAPSYDYDAEAYAYDEWRRKARAFAHKKTQEALLRQQLLTKVLLRGFDIFLLIILGFNISLIIDRHLPLEAYSNQTMTNQTITKTRTPNYDILEFENYVLYLKWGALDGLRGGQYQSASVYATAWYDKPLFLDLNMRGKQYRFEQKAGIYGFFSFCINGVLLLAIFYKLFVKSLDSQLSVAILILFIWVFECFIFLKY